MSDVETQADRPAATDTRGHFAWYRAVTLAERLAGVVPDASKRGTGARPPSPAEEDRLRYCLSSWKSQPPFDDLSYFQQRLALDGITEADFRDLVLERPDEIHDRLAQVPAWMSAIEAALGRPPAFEFHRLLTSRLRKNPSIGFLDVAAPFIDDALGRLRAGAATIAGRAQADAFDPDCVDALLFPSLAKSLLRLVSQTLVLELNVARVAGTLDGPTAEARFAAFIGRFRSADRLRELFEEYPVLARLIVEHTGRWVDVGLELLERLAADAAALGTAFGLGGPLGRAVDVRSGLADPHERGRSVAVVRFSSGARIVYKPKPLAIDAHFQELLAWLSAEGFTPAFRPLTIVRRDGYAWEEFVSPAPCGTLDQVTRFYERAGGLIAVLYVTEATDLHAGNLVASGEHPMLIDLEALFHPHRSPPPAAAASADALAGRWVRSSVLRIGLLPERRGTTAEYEGIDLSGLGTAQGQLTPHAVADWEGAGTDAMRLVRHRKTVEPDGNRPMLGDQAVDVLDFREALGRGFRLAYSMLAERRPALVAPDGHLRRFDRDPVSVFLRSSRTYRRLLRESYHPDVLRDALDRDRLFDRLWAEVPGDGDLTQVIGSERDDLWNGDIPCFSARPDSRDLWFGTRHIENFFPEPSVASAERLVARLGEADCARQAWFIDASLASLPGALDRWPSSIVPHTGPKADVDRLLGGAIDVGTRLEALAVRAGGTASWIGLDHEEHRVWAPARAALDLEAGVPGIALFLAYLGAVTGRDEPTVLAGEALATMHELVATRGPSIARVGGFDGLGGIIYALAHLSVLWRRPDLAFDAEALAARLPELVGDSDEVDVYAGSAGAILALRSLARALTAGRIAPIAVRCGDHLIDRLHSLGPGEGGPEQTGDGVPPGGFAFGAAGIAVACWELFRWTGLDRFRSAGLGTVERERRRTAASSPASLPGAGPDDAADDASGRGAKASRQATWRREPPWTPWSRGAVAISVSHLTGSVGRMTPPARLAVVALAEEILARGLGRNHSLGYGDVGNLDFLKQAAVVLGDEAMMRVADVTAGAVLDDIERHGWRCGTPLGIETPGLVAGLAGIGYGLLRIARPADVPSILTLEPPPEWRPHGH